MIVFNIFLLVFLIIFTQYLLNSWSRRKGQRDTFHHRFLYYIFMAVYFSALLFYDSLHGMPVSIPIHWNFKDILLALSLSAAGILILGMILLFDYLSRYERSAETAGLVENEIKYVHVPKWLGVLILSLCTGILEELIFRYYIIDRISMLTPHLDWAVGLSSILYGLTHYSKAGWFSVCYTGVIGFLIAVLYILTDNLLVIISIHFVWIVLVLSITNNRLIQFFQRHLNQLS